MTQPDPEFLDFFAGEWQRLLERVKIPDMNNPSWDRRAAYLLWIMGGHYDAETPWYWRDVMRQVVMPGEPAPPPRPLSEVLTVHKEDTTQFPYAPPAPIVGMNEWDRAYIEWQGRPLVNHADDADCVPDPEGVKFHFDAVKVSGEK